MQFRLMTLQDLDDTASSHLTSAKFPKIISIRNFFTEFKSFPFRLIRNKNRLLNHLELREKRAFFPSNRSIHNEINPRWSSQQFLRHGLRIALFWLQLLSKSGHKSVYRTGATGWILPLRMIFRADSIGALGKGSIGYFTVVVSMFHSIPHKIGLRERRPFQPDDNAPVGSKISCRSMNRQFI